MNGITQGNHKLCYVPVKLKVLFAYKFILFLI